MAPLDMKDQRSLSPDHHRASAKGIPLHSITSLELQAIKKIVPYFTKMSFSDVWTSYDRQTDVLYISFKRSALADDSEMQDDNTIIRYEKGQVVGITILNASKR